MPARLRWSIALAALAVFVLLALQLVTATGLAALDLGITRALQARRGPALDALMLALSNSHSTTVVLIAAVVLAAWRWRRADRPAAWSLAAVPAGELLNVGLKNLFERPRPVVPEPLVHLSTYSFPSGHAVASTLFYGALCALVWQRVRSRRLRIVATAVAVLMVLLVSFSRVYLGAHYASDVLAGIAVGTFCVALLLRPPAAG
jgi:membrane-associated phospholipid phosphatase